MEIDLPKTLHDWEVKNVDEIFWVNSEVLPNSTDPGFEFRYIPLESVYKEGIDYASVERLKFGEAPSRARRIIKRGDLLVATVRPNLQGFAEFQPPEDGIPYICSTGFAVLRAKKGHDQQFYLQELLSDFGARQFHAYVTGTNYPAISERDFGRLKLLVPKLPDIENYAALLIRGISEAIVATHDSVAKAERMQKGLMQQLLSGRFKPDGSPRQKKEFWNHPKVGHVPENWKVSPLKGLAEIQRGKFSYRPRNEPRFFGGPYPFIQTADIVASRGYIRKHSQTLSEEGKAISRLFPSGSIMITIAAHIGDTAIAAYDVYATDSVIGITPKEGVDSEFLELCLRMRKGYLQRMATESAQANINYGNLRPLLISHPETPDEQNAVARPILTCEALILARQAKIIALQRLKKSLMQDLLTGRIRLPVSQSEPLTATV